MKSQPETTLLTPDISGLSTAELLSMVVGLQQQLASKDSTLEQRDRQLQQREQYILLLEEMLRLQRIQRFAASSEKTAHQLHLFDESELEAEIDNLRDQLPDDIEVDDTSAATSVPKRRQRGFSDNLLRERI